MFPFRVNHVGIVWRDELSQADFDDLRAGRMQPCRVTTRSDFRNGTYDREAVMRGLVVVVDDDSPLRNTPIDLTSLEAARASFTAAVNAAPASIVPPAPPTAPAAPGYTITHRSDLVM